MTIVSARYVEAIRTGEAFRIAIAGSHNRNHSLTLANPRRSPTICAILAEARVAVTPMGGTLRFAGTMEIAGLNEDINPVRVRGIVAAATHYYPEIQAADFEGVAPWRGLRPCSPDGMPYVGRTARFANSSLGKAVNITRGMAGWRRRHSHRNSMPSMPGILKSDTMRSTCSLPRNAKPFKQPESPDYNAKLVAVGKSAPVFAVPSPAGGSVSLAESTADHKAVLVNFWFYG